MCAIVYTIIRMCLIVCALGDKPLRIAVSVSESRSLLFNLDVYFHRQAVGWDLEASESGLML